MQYDRYTVSTIIVTYNSAGEISQCLRSLVHALSFSAAEVIIIDNNSSDSTADVIVLLQGEYTEKKIVFHIIQNHENVGFTRATNQGLRRATGEFVLLLNPDVEVSENTITHLIAYMRENSGVGAVAPQLRYPDGTIQPSCRRFPKGRDLLFALSGVAALFRRSAFFNRWKMADFDHTSLREVEQPQGAFLLLRRSACERIGLLDERFEMFFSDVDWCRRLRERGMRIVFCPDVGALHHKGASVYGNRVRMIIQSHRDFARYFKKYPGDTLLPPWLAMWMLLIAAWPRILAELVWTAWKRR